MISSEIIRTKEMYNFYINDIKARTSLCKEKIENLNKSKSYLLGNLENSKDYITTFTKIDFNTIANLNKPIPFSYFNTNNVLKDIGLKASNLVSLIININIELNLQYKILEKLLQEDINLKLYKKIIEAFNKKISNEILKGYSFGMGNKLSFIKIKRQVIKNTSTKRIDWKESKIKRQEILNRGGIPFKVLQRDDLKRPIADNGGELWFVYHNDYDLKGINYDFLWYWNKSLCKVANSHLYKFRPTVNSNTKEGKYELGNANKLKKLQRENSEFLKNFI